MRLWSLWVTPDSDVTTRLTTTPKAGSTAAAGVVSGAWLGQPGGSTAVVWECAASRSWRFIAKRKYGKAVVLRLLFGLVTREAATTKAARGNTP